MSDPQSYVADQIGQQSTGLSAPAASEEEIAARAQASSGIGVTESDIAAIMARIKDMEAQLAEQARAARPSSSLVGTVATLNHHLGGHGDPRAAEYGKDLTEAAAAAEESGDTSRLAAINARLLKHLKRNPPYPGENYFYRGALDGAENHVPDAIDGFVPPAPPAAAVGSSQPPAKVVEGSVVA